MVTSFLQKTKTKYLFVSIINKIIPVSITLEIRPQDTKTDSKRVRTNSIEFCNLLYICMMLVRMIMSQMVLITSFCFEDCITIVASVLQVQMF